MQKITPWLWFDTQAEDAARFYVSIFKGGKLGRITRYPEEMAGHTGRPVGSVLTVEFEIEGQKFGALNGGPMFKLSEAVSFMVGCESQAELDDLNARLLDGGGEQQPCGWVKDKFGVSWQIIPVAFMELMHDQDQVKVTRMMGAMMQMTKLDLAALQHAFDGQG